MPPHRHLQEHKITVAEFGVLRTNFSWHDRFAPHRSEHNDGNSPAA
jgi:hypothetical protein